MDKRDYMSRIPKIQGMPSKIKKKNSLKKIIAQKHFYITIVSLQKLQSKSKTN